MCFTSFLHHHYPQTTQRLNMRTTQLLAAATLVASATAFVPPTLLPKARVAAVRQRSTLRMDAGEDTSKLAKIEQLKVRVLCVC